MVDDAKGDRPSGASSPAFSVPLLVLSVLLLPWSAPSLAEQEGASPSRRELRFQLLSADEFAPRRSQAPLGDVEAARLVYEHISINTGDPSALIQLRLAAELAHSPALFEIGNKPRNHEHAELALRYKNAMRADPRTRLCFVPAFGGLVALHLEGDEAEHKTNRASDGAAFEVRLPASSEAPSAATLGKPEAVRREISEEAAVGLPEVEGRLGRVWFWSVLDTPDPSSPASPGFEDRLPGLGYEELVALEWHMRRLVRELGTAKVYGALYAASGGLGVSDDVFEYMRYWIVHQGEAFYSAMTKDPDALAELIAGDCREAFSGWWSDGEIVGYAVESEIRSRGLSEEEFNARVGVGRGESVEDFDWRIATQLDFPRIRKKCAG